MEGGQADDTRLSPFVRFSREEWGRLLAATSLSVSEEDVRYLQRISEHLSSEEATKDYLPLSWFLYLHVSATQDLYRRERAFLAKGKRRRCPMLWASLAASLRARARWRKCCRP